MAARAILLAGLLIAAAPAGATDTKPLSAIDWLTEMARQGAQIIDEPEIAPSVAVPDVAVTALEGTTPKRVGLIAPDVTGFPADLWANSDGTALATAISRLGTVRLPAAQALMYTLLLGEADPPRAGADAFDLARVDALIKNGAIEPALALLDQAGADRSPDHFARYADLTLFTGASDNACRIAQAQPRLSDDLVLRVFCLARAGDWNTAALVLGSAEAIGSITPTDGAALAQFLDAELFEGEVQSQSAARMTPLRFRIDEATGHRPSTSPLPRAYAHADLDGNAGWKAQIVAAERLARAGAVSENQLIGVYSDRKPAASGGVWDRVRAVQALDLAITSGDVAKVSAALPPAWEIMRGSDLGVPFAALFAEKLPARGLSGTSGDITYQMLLLSPDYETAARLLPDLARAEPVLNGIASGETKALRGANLAEATLVDVFANRIAPDPELIGLARDGALGLAILKALTHLKDGISGDVTRLGQSLATLRALGLEDMARRAALQILILGRAS